MTIRLKSLLRYTGLLLVLAVLSFSIMLAIAQPQIGGRGKNISLPGYDSQNRQNSLLMAKEAVPKGT
ncbi:MAG: hypothetical protein K0Q55_2964, partial [Verrucomicrobia bacterium]|nr:hypothetical protein [Verrucomicrobiota bacterium]